MEIPVNVGDDGHSHGRRTLAKRAGLLALAAVWVVSGFYLWRTSVPRLHIPELDPRDYFSAAELSRAHEYRRVSRALLLGSLAAQLVVLALLVWKARPLADALEGIGRGRIRTGVLVAIAVPLALWLATVPFGAVSLWWRRRYGLSTQTAAGWLRDQAVAVGVECLLVAAAAGVTLGLAAWLGRSWWLAAAPLFVLAGVLYFVAQPLVVQPLFNRFEPLADQRLTAEIKKLGAKEGVTVDKVLVADASRRTSPAWARPSGSSSTTRSWTGASARPSSSPSPPTSWLTSRAATSGGASAGSRSSRSRASSSSGGSPSGAAGCRTPVSCRSRSPLRSSIRFSSCRSGISCRAATRRKPTGSR
jgi:CAAX prenyl protease N-terminal, five membrane helices